MKLYFDKEKIIGFVLCSIGGGLAGYIGGGWAILAVVLAELGISLILENNISHYAIKQ